MFLIDWGNDMLQNKIELENEAGEELYTLAELVKVNPEFTVDQLRKWIKTGRLEAVQNKPGGTWWTSEEALERAKRSLRRRQASVVGVGGLSERDRTLLRLLCGYKRDKDGNFVKASMEDLFCQQ